MRRDASIITFVGALTLLFLLLAATRHLAAFLPFAFIYIVGFTGQVALVYSGSQWAGISLKILYPIAVLTACGLALITVAWVSGSSFSFLLSSFFSKGGLSLAFAPYVVANLITYILVIAHRPAPRQTL